MNHRNRNSIPLALWRLSAVTLGLLIAVVASAAPGRVRGRIVAQDTGEPLSFVNVALIPVDTTMARAGGLSNSDGTFDISAAEGLYTLRIAQMSYARRTVTGVRVEAAKPFELGTFALTPEAIQMKEIVVEARVLQSSEGAVLAQRRKAASVQDAVSAEQVRKSPDKDAGDVLRRVTGLSVNDGKFVYVRGLGERYSSTEVDGVRLASPEMNRRVVPLDLIPAALLDNITVQKTYTADRPAEFGGGDVQVRTKDFPGRRTLALSVGRGVESGVTFERVQSYAGPGGDRFALGGAARDFPALFQQLAAHVRVVERGSLPGQTGLTGQEIAAIGRSFANRWTPTTSQARPNQSYSVVIGDEWKIGARSLGFIGSGSYGHSTNDQREEQRYFVGQALSAGTTDRPRFDLDVRRSSENAQMSGQGKLSARLAPNHSLHLGAFYNRSADDEVRSFQGFSEDINDSIRSSRLRYSERSIGTLALEGRHEFPRARGAKLEWKVSRSKASNDIPDERESRYQRSVTYDDNDSLISVWSLRPGRGATLKFRRMAEQGRGMEATLSAPVTLPRLGNGRVTLGLSDQWKNRSFLYRRFALTPGASFPTASPETLFAPGTFDGTPRGSRLEEYTQAGDHYDAEQGQTAGFVTAELAVGKRLRTTLGFRVENGVQLLRAYDVFDPFNVATTTVGRLDDVDVLPSANATWAVREDLNLRAGASRTLSRPDLGELSPARIEDYVPGFRDMPGFVFIGNPKLERSLIRNLDARLEWFPGPAAVLALGVFEKKLERPIELSAIGGTEPIFKPLNSTEGRNAGVELEARSSLGRLWKPLARFAINANASWIHSEVRLPRQITELTSRAHALQGQADRLWNVGLNWATADGRVDATLLGSYVGRKLVVVGIAPAPDFYDEPLTRLDATVNVKPMQSLRVKLAATNLTDAVTIVKQGPIESLRYTSGRAYSVSVGVGQ